MSTAYLSQNAKDVLSTIHVLIADIERIPEPTVGGRDGWELGRYRHEQRKKLTEGFGHREVIERWLGGVPNGADRRAYHRACDELESAGLVERVYSQFMYAGHERSIGLRLSQPKPNPEPTP